MTMQETLPEKIEEDWFLLHFGHFQNSWRAATGKDLQLDFSNVQWIDPMPMLALIAELSHCVQSGFISSVRIDLGEWGLAKHSLRSARARKYLALHGYIRCLATALGSSVSFSFKGHADALSRE